MVLGRDETSLDAFRQLLLGLEPTELDHPNHLSRYLHEKDLLRVKSLP